MTESERDTRKNRIDPNLEAAGWSVGRSIGMTAETTLWPVAVPELSTSFGPADYALCVAQRVYAVVEPRSSRSGLRAC